MSEHVKEPWSCVDNSQEWCWVLYIKNADNNTLCETIGADRFDRRNAKRIVAAVNACASLDIPDNVPVGAISDVVQSLRTLITECRVYRIQAGCEEQESTYMDEARSALAKLDAK